jgi:hypothetical protein
MTKTKKVLGEMMAGAATGAVKGAAEAVVPDQNCVSHFLTGQNGRMERQSACNGEHHPDWAERGCLTSRCLHRDNPLPGHTQPLHCKAL